MKTTQGHDAHGGAVGSSKPAHATPRRNRKCGEQFKATFRDTSYYSTGRDWKDYAPAYRYGYQAFDQHGKEHSRFEDIEHVLARHWDNARERSRLSWVEACSAVEDAWQRAANEAAQAQAPAVDGEAARH